MKQNGQQELFPGMVPTKKDIEALRLLEDFGSLGESIGSGIARTAFPLSDTLIVKVQRKRSDWSNQTGSEIERWRNASSEDRQWLCPILAWGETADGLPWIIMPRCEVRAWGGNGDDRERWTAAIHELEEHLDDEDWLGDVHTYNVGLLDGRPVLIDYGM
jgi:hypothetical protein